MNIDIDYGSAAAVQYNQLFKKMLDAERKKQDNLDLTEAQTNQNRGRIAVLKELIALPNTQEVLDAQSKFEHPVD